jgi:site-specific DNA-methyltransferase (adenine-specific)
MGYLNLVGVGDSLEYLRQIPDNSIDSIVTDPPYGLGKPPPPHEVLAAWTKGEDYKAKGTGFLGNTWDVFVPGPPIWRECLRVLKPGGLLVAFFGTRTYDWGTLAIRLAGFDVTDSLAWIYGSGFPKGQDIGKQIDKHLGTYTQREVVGTKDSGLDKGSNGQAKLMTKVGRNAEGLINVTKAFAPEAQAWEGWNTALKPAHEPVLLARKPMIGKFAENVLAHGTGGLNIEGCGVGGRYPNNVMLGHLESCDDDTCADGCAVATIGQQSGHSVSRPMKGDAETLDLVGHTSVGTMQRVGTQLNDEGTAARFFYTAKALSKNRWAYCKKCKVVINHTAKKEFNAHLEDHEDEILSHPTQKPIKLMEWLIKLVTQEGGVVLDPFCGTGTTAVAAKRLKRNFVTCELSPDYAKIASARVGTVGVEAVSQLQQGSYFCPGCRAKGEIKLIAKKAVDRMKDSGKKTTCMKCMKRYAYEDLV